VCAKGYKYVYKCVKYIAYMYIVHIVLDRFMHVSHIHVCTPPLTYLKIWYKDKKLEAQFKVSRVWGGF